MTLLDMQSGDLLLRHDLDVGFCLLLIETTTPMAFYDETHGLENTRKMRLILE